MSVFVLAMAAARYKLFLGYDPGGNRRHGVAAARVASDGAFESEPETCLLADAEEVCRWVSEHHAEASGLCIDTLLAWSYKGGRKCDTSLRKHYSKQQQSVIPQNSLRSAMTINGVLVAQHARHLGLRLLESHPKLVLHLCRKDPEAQEFLDWHAGLKRSEDHEADALVAAWCASRWAFGRWGVDLYTVGEDLFFPAGTAAYPWPEPIGTGMAHKVLTSQTSAQTWSMPSKRGALGAL